MGIYVPSAVTQTILLVHLVQLCRYKIKAGQNYKENKTVKIIWKSHEKIEIRITVTRKFKKERKHQITQEKNFH